MGINKTLLVDAIESASKNLIGYMPIGNIVYKKMVYSNTMWNLNIKCEEEKLHIEIKNTDINDPKYLRKPIVHLNEQADIPMLDFTASELIIPMFESFILHYYGNITSIEVENKDDKATLDCTFEFNRSDSLRQLKIHIEAEEFLISYILDELRELLIKTPYKSLEVIQFENKINITDMPEFELSKVKSHLTWGAALTAEQVLETCNPYEINQAIQKVKIKTD